METKEGIINSISIQEGIKGNKPWKRWEFALNDGHKYSTFDEKIGNSGFKSGDKVTIKGEQSGKYWNMKEMCKAGQEKANSEPVNSSNDVIELLRKILAELKGMTDRLDHLAD